MKGMNKRKFLSLKSITLMGLGLIAVALTAFLVLGPDFALATKPDNRGKGKPEKPPELYKVSMYLNGQNGMYTTCSPWGYVLAEWDGKHKLLHANGTFMDKVISIDPYGYRVPLLLNLSTNPQVTKGRKYPQPYVVYFNGCFGETADWNGSLYIYFQKKKGKSYISFVWHFDYYIDAEAGVREHFTLATPDRTIEFPAWTGEDLSENVSGPFEFQYYLMDSSNRIIYEPIATCDFNFLLTIEKVN